MPPETSDTPDTTWEHIFLQESIGPKDQYKDLLMGFRQEYEKNNSLDAVLLDTSSNPDFPTTIFLRKDTPVSDYTKVQKLQNGDIQVEFHRQDSILVKRVTPKVGNVRPEWDYKRIRNLQETIKAMVQDVPTNEKEIVLALSLSYIRGELAYEDQEDPRWGDGISSVRVGYYIFPDKMLIEAQAIIDDAMVQ